MDQDSDPHFRIIAAIPTALLAAAVVETFFRPAPGGSYALLVFVLLSPALLVWLIWRLQRQT